MNILSTGPSFENPQVAFDSDGNGVVIWKRTDEDRLVIQASMLPADGHRWTLPIVLSEMHPESK